MNPESPSYSTLRTVSVLATLATSAACGLLAFWLSGSWLAGATGALIWLGFPVVGAFGPTDRSDMPTLALAFAGLLVAYRYRRSRVGLGMAALLMVLSFFYKQQFVAAPVAVLLSLASEKKWRQLPGLPRSPAAAASWRSASSSSSSFVARTFCCISSLTM